MTNLPSHLAQTSLPDVLEAFAVQPIDFFSLLASLVKQAKGGKGTQVKNTIYRQKRIGKEERWEEKEG